MKRKNQPTPPLPGRGVSMLSSAIALSLALPFSAQAFEFKNGEVSGNFDTTISAGASWRMEKRDPSLVSSANGGTSRDPNGDDGNLKYDKGDIISSVVKATHDLELNYRDYGAFLRGSYFYDYAIMHKDGMTSAAKDQAGRDFEILDAYVHGRFDVAGRDLSLRLGRQVVNWGESTFIMNGISVLNPFNVTRLRAPGAELKEGLIPTAMLWGSQQITDDISVEAVLPLEWKETKIDPVGTFFSPNDFVGPGGDRGYISYGRRNDRNGRAGVFPVHSDAALWAPRGEGRDAKNNGQYGIALRAFLPSLNYAEIGVYHINYHSHTPVISGYRGGITSGGTVSNRLTPQQAGALDAAGIPAVSNGMPGCSVFDVATFGAMHNAANIAKLAKITGSVEAATKLSALNATNAACAVAAQNGGAGHYFIEYPENIKLFGVSFSAEGPGGIALQGEYSYRHNQPLQLPAAELLQAAIGIGNQLTSTDPRVAARVPYGTELSGYRRVKMHQLQVTGTKVFGPMLGASQLITIGEVGFTHLKLGQTKFAAPGCLLPQPTSTLSGSFGSYSQGCFMSKNSWGYRVRAQLDYPGAIAGATLSPKIAFSHDVSGRGPSFNEGAKALTIGLDINYKQNWLANIAYTSYFGGEKYSGVDPVSSPAKGFPANQKPEYASHSNPMSDKDFLSVSLSYSF